MAKGFKHGAGGGGASLNFKVVGGTTKPASPKENTIWVNTNAEITSWIFSASEPKTATQGMVWISVGTSSTVEFNALKKNGIQVYPLSAKQYVSRAWVDKTAKSYQSGAWVDWIPEGTLYSDGDERVTFVGYVNAGGTGSFNKASDGLVISSNNYSIIDAYFTTEELVNTDGYSKLEVTVEISGSNPVLGFGIVTTKTNVMSFDTFVSISHITTSGVHTVPVNGGNYYINVCMTQQGTAKVKKIRLVK